MKAETKAESKKPPPEQTWSGMPLEYGVRMIVVPDILFDALDKGADLAILRNSSAPPFGELVDPCDPALMARIGSAYSVDALRASMEAELAKGDSALERALPPWLRLKAWIAKQVPRLDASARDLRSRASLTPQQWRWFDAHLPSAFPAYQQRPYFCSQLVLQLLQESRLLGPGAIQAAVTPTGLHKALSDLGWNDVTGSSYSAEAIARLRTDHFLKTTHQANFASLRMIQNMHESIQINAIKVDVIRAHIDELTGSLRTARDRLNKISSAMPTR